MKLFLVVLKILFVGGLFIISNHNLHLSDNLEREQFLDAYSAWVGTLGKEGVQLTGYLVKFEWLPPKNATEFRSILEKEKKFPDRNG